MPFGQPHTRRGRGLLPLSSADWEAVRQTGLTEQDVRDLDDVLLSTRGLSRRSQFVLLCRMLVRRGIKKLAPAAAQPQARSRPESGQARPPQSVHQVAAKAPSPETLTKLDAVLDQLGPAR